MAKSKMGIEFLDDGTRVIEKFLNGGNIYDEAELGTFIRDFSDEVRKKIIDRN